MGNCCPAMTTVEFLQQRHEAADRNTIQLWKNKGLDLYLGFPGSSSGKESACNAGDPSSVLSLEDPLEKGMATHSSILGLPWWLSW